MIFRNNLIFIGFSLLATLVTVCNSEEMNSQASTNDMAKTRENTTIATVPITTKNPKQEQIQQKSKHAFTLQSADGTVSLSDFKGKVAVLYFGYTSCPDICPSSLAIMSAALKKLDEEESKQVQPILISLDPERDTVEKLKEYVHYFMPNMIGLKGNKEETKRIAKNYHVNFRKTDVDSALSYVVDHASIYFIIGKDGNLFSHLLHDVTPKEITEKVRLALKQEVKPASDKQDITVLSPYIRETPPGQSISALFMTLQNNSDTEKSLIKVSGDIAKSIEIHQHSHKNGMMEMRKIDKVTIPANNQTALKPGGYHVMLIGLNKKLKSGNTFDLTLHFNDDSKQLIKAKVLNNEESLQKK